MATYQTLVDRALRLIKVIGAGQSPTSSESADALIALNSMLDSWKNDKLMAYAVSDVPKVMTVADASYTIGSGGDINTTRPVAIEDAYMTIDGKDYPVNVCSDKDWFAIVDKTVTGDLVESVWYNPTMPLGTINVYPVPSVANTLHLVLRSPLTTVALADTVSLPPGWEKAIAFNLAIDLAPEFEATVSREVAKGASDSMAAIKRINQVSIRASTGLIELMSQGKADILIGE